MLQKTRQYVVLFLTILVVMFAFAGYFLLYVPSKTQEINERNFRVLSKISDNSLSKAASFANNAHTSAESAIKELYWTNGKLFTGKLKAEDLQPTLNEFQAQLKTKVFNRNIRFDKLDVENTSSDTFSSIGRFELAQERNEYRLTYKDTLSHFGDLPKLESTLKELGLHYEFKFSFGLNAFFSSLIRPEFFDEYFVVKDAEVVYSTFNAGLDIKNPDSLLTESAVDGIMVSDLKDIEISGIPYKLFMQPLKVSSGNWVLCGLIPRDRYNAEKLSVSSYTVFIISLILILGLLSLPFLKLGVMSRDERLQSSDAMLSAFSLIFSAALITLLFFHVHSFVDEEGKQGVNWKVDSNLYHVSESIKNHLTTELSEINDRVRLSDIMLGTFTEIGKANESKRNNIGLDVVNILTTNDLTPEVQRKKEFELEKQQDAGRSPKANDKQLKEELEDLKKDLINVFLGLGQVELDSAELETGDYDSNQVVIVKDVLDELKKPEEGAGTSSSTKEDKEKAVRDSLITNEKTTAEKLAESAYPFFNTISWIDKRGRQINKWSATGKVSAHVNVGTRDYFKRVSTGTAWKDPSVSDSTFFLQSIVALNTGRNEAAVAFPARENEEFRRAEVITLTTELQSIMDPVLPFGYGFCIIDKKGSVLFHSTQSRNLQENLLEETDNNADLEAALYAGGSSIFEASYHGKGHKMHISPLLQTPLYLVAFTEPLVLETAHTQVISYTLIMFLVYIVLMGLQLLFISLSQSTPTKLYSQRYRFNWLWPKKTQIQRYLMVSVLFIITMLHVTFRNVGQDPLVQLYNTLFCALYSVLIAYYVLNAEVIRKKNALAIMLFTTTPVVLFVAATHKVLVYDVGLFSWAKIDVLVVPLLFLALLWIYVLGSDKTIEKFESLSGKALNFKKINIDQAYLSMVFAWMGLCVVLPITVFFAIGYNQETEIMVRHRQLEYANAILDRDERIQAQYGNRKSGTESLAELRRGIEYDINLHSDEYLNIENTLAVGSVVNDPDANPLNTSESFLHNYNTLRASYSSLSQKTSDLLLNKTSNPSQWTTYCDRIEYFNQLSDGKTLRISSPQYRFQLPSLLKASKGSGLNRAGVVFWVLVIGTLVLMYYAVKFVMHRIFAFSPLGNEYTPHMLENIDFLKDIHDRTFIVSLPYSGLESQLKPSKQLGIFDLYKELIKDADAFEAAANQFVETPYKQYVILGFEYLMDSKEANMKKLRLIEQLDVKDKIQVVIISNLDTWHLFEHLHEIEDEDKDKTFRTRWNLILGGFKHVYFPIETRTSLPLPNREAGKDIVNAQILANRECKHGTFLGSIIEQTHREIETWPRPVDREDVILHIQSLAKSYYHTLWASCTDREKLLIYDLSEDGFVNEKNAQTIDSLLNKGILVVEDGKLRLFNRSFRNFVLTVIDRNVALKAELTQANEGSWSKFKTPLVVIIIALGAFIMVTQQGALNNALSFFGALATALLSGYKIIETFQSLRGSKSSG